MASLREDAGAVLTIGFEGQEFEGAAARLFAEVRPGGAIFFQRNIASGDEGAAQFHALARSVHAALRPPNPVLALDQEGGEVDRFRALIAPLPSARDAARAGLARELGYVAGRQLAAFGLNVDFAPVLDLHTSDGESVLGSRTAGATASEVTHFAQEFLGGLSEWGVLGCGKHFPGLGSGRCDSHSRMPHISKPAPQLWAADLVPYHFLKKRLPMVMVAHAWYPALEDSGSPQDLQPRPVPASLSRTIVSGLLKRRIGYEGLVICDDLEMGGALEGRGVGEAAVAAVRAGCEMLLVCRREQYVRQAFEALIREGERDAEFAEMLSAAAAKIASSRAGAPRVPIPERAPDLMPLREEAHELSWHVQKAAASVASPAGGAPGC